MTCNEQMSWKLRADEIDRLCHVGEIRRHAAGEPLFVTGEDVRAAIHAGFRGVLLERVLRSPGLQ
jgi:hypothetical protein